MSVSRRQRNDRADGYHRSISVHAAQPIQLAFKTVLIHFEVLYVRLFLQVDFMS